MLASPAEDPQINPTPTADDERERLSSILENVFRSDSEVKTLGALVDTLDHHGMAVILILFSIPAALPIPAAGYSTVLSVPLLLMGGRLLLGYNSMWLPEKFRARPFRTDSLSRFAKTMISIAQTIERFSKPRQLPLFDRD